MAQAGKAASTSKPPLLGNVRKRVMAYQVSRNMHWFVQPGSLVLFGCERWYLSSRPM